MSKAVLKTICECGKDGQYSWSLFFFKTDKRNKQPYKVFKVRFKNAKYEQIYGYVQTGNETYITRHGNAREKIKLLDNSKLKTIVYSKVKGVERIG